MKEIDSITETGHTVEIDHKATTKMTIRRKIIGILKTRDIREGLEITMKTGTARIRIGINMETDTDMTGMTRLNVDLRRKITCVMMIYFTQKLKEYTKFYKQ